MTYSNAMQKQFKRNKLGFSLVEIMIVVGIITMLAALAIPAFIRARAQARAGRIASDLRVVSSVFAQYALETGNFPNEAAMAVIPRGLEGQLGAMNLDWTKPLPIGGHWDWDPGSGSSDIGIAIVNVTSPSNEVILIDRVCDDGNLDSGIFQSLGDNNYKYYFDL